MTDVTDLAADVRDSARTYLPVLRAGLEEAARRLTLGQDDGFHLLAAALDGLEWVGHVLGNVRLFVGAPAVVAAWQDLGARYLAALRLVLEAWENRDGLALGETLRYELVPVLAEFQALLVPEEGLSCRGLQQ